ncbi:DUF4411 family protein [bacterium]|nr:DUF4411 family protein [bacterium]
MAYVLDADVFIRAKNLHYGLDFCPAFWEWILIQNSRDNLYSIEKVSDEIMAVEDSLSEWAKDRGSDFFLKPSPAIVTALTEVSTWASTQDYEPSAVSTFLQVADYYLVSHAKASQFTVVTHEVPSASKKKIKIPDVCIGLDIKFMTPFQMLRRERARFILDEMGKAA